MKKDKTTRIESNNANASKSKNQSKEDQKQMTYHQYVQFMKELKSFFNKEYLSDYKTGKINQASKDYTYFSLTPEELKLQKLKFVIIYDHIPNSFTICLSGQNKSIRKETWQLFKGSDWDKYHLSESINNSLMIIDHKIIEGADFSDKNKLTLKIEKESILFMNDLKEVLE